MKVELIEKPTRHEAWTDAAERLVAGNDKHHFVLDIAEPCAVAPEEAATFRALNAYYAERRKKDPDADISDVATVANTIFPQAFYEIGGLEMLDKEYAEEYYSRIKRGRWGTYAYRILRAEDANGELIRARKNKKGCWVQVVGKDAPGVRPFNPLNRLVEKMRAEVERGSNPPPVHACYELSIYRPTPVDSNHRLGGPCLSHLSFKLLDGEVYLTAVYRHHDYTLKAPGNLLGLALLQRAVAYEVGAEIGRLVIDSTLAFRGIKVSQRDLKRILKSAAAGSSSAGQTRLPI